MKTMHTLKVLAVTAALIVPAVAFAQEHETPPPPPYAGLFDQVDEAESFRERAEKAHGVKLNVVAKGRFFQIKEVSGQ